MRQPLRNKRPGAQEISSADVSPAPVKGWNTRDPVAAMAPGYALVLDNWFPTAANVQIRRGMREHSTGLPGDVKTLASWAGLNASKLFAVTDSGVFDVTAAGPVGGAVQALTNGYCQFINFNTTGQSYLVLVNGTDDLAYTNGSTWNTIASFPINGGGNLLSKDIININAFKRSIYFIEKDSMNFYYLPIDQINGTVSKFPIGALFTRGGRLVAMGTWTLDGGQGLEDYSVFVTSKGQMAVYQGTDPSSANTWQLKGIYDFAEPLGPRCFLKYGGDLLAITRLGLFSMNTALASTRMDLRSSISDLIGEAFSEAATYNGDYFGWQTVYFPDADLLFTNVPLGNFSAAHQYAMNAQTKAWCRFTGWDTFCWEVHNKRLFAGMDGKVVEAWTATNDLSSAITATCKTAFNYYRPRMRIKEWKMLQPILEIEGTTTVNIGLDSDFRDSYFYTPGVSTSGALSRYDQAHFDASRWSADPEVRLDWVTTAAKPSHCAAIRLRVTALDATVAWSATNIIYEVGALAG